MRARRSDKSFPLTSEEIEKHFAARLLSRFPELEIDLKHADLIVEVEIRRRRAFVSFERIAGAGGLPSGTSGNVLTLLSGGFDSPVASYEMMRRGCHVDFLTFHSSPYTPPATLEKVTELVRQLNMYQKKGCLGACNLVEAQKAIRDKCLSKHRTVLYRRMMMRIAETVADGLKALAIVTGDNLGQVASQTLTNMSIISNVTRKMLLRPLLTFDKLQIISIADTIGTSAISARNVPDSCTVFAPDNPTTMADLQKIIEDEQHLDIPALLQQCLEKTCFLNPKTLFEHPWFDKQLAD
jgi:thiamine biosynthesis protein ThiI